MVRTAMSSQGLTFNGGVIADLRRAGGMADDIWWLNIYVMLSRARKLENLILIGLTPQIKELLEAGPPTYIRKQIKALQEKAKRTCPQVYRGSHPPNVVHPDVRFLAHMAIIWGRRTPIKSYFWGRGAKGTYRGIQLKVGHVMY